MIRRFTSEQVDPRERGVAFGETWREEVGRTIAGYRALFAHVAGRSVDVDRWGAQVRTAIGGWAPSLAAEIEGIARGAGVPAEHVYAINARTEILAALDGPLRGECSTVVQLRDDAAPISVQTWDWHAHLADQWLVWTIAPGGVRRLETLTEFGIVGKIAVGAEGVGVHFNLLRHRSDGEPLGVPVHVVARRAIEEAGDLEEALRIVASARVSASTTLTFVAMDGRDASALSVELSPDGPRYVLPDSHGLLLHTNHFLDPAAAVGDREPSIGGDSYLRLDLLRRRLAARPAATVAAAVRALDSHLGGVGALCAHPPGGAGEAFDYETLATVSLELAAGHLDVHAGGPCTLAAVGHHLNNHEGAIS